MVPSLSDSFAGYSEEERVRIPVMLNEAYKLPGDVQLRQAEYEASQGSKAKLGSRLLKSKFELRPESVGQKPEKIPTSI